MEQTISLATLLAVSFDFFFASIKECLDYSLLSTVILVFALFYFLFFIFLFEYSYVYNFFNTRHVRSSSYESQYEVSSIFSKLASCYFFIFY